MPRESSFLDHLVERLEAIIPSDSLILRTDSVNIQGFPDLLVFFGGQWAGLEVKASESSPKRPNQKYWVERLNNMSFCRFIFPENEEEVLDELQRSFFS